MPGTENLATALAQFQLDLPKIAKDKVAKVKTDKANYQYNYADLSSVTEALLPALAAQGLAWSCGPDVSEHGHLLLRWRLLHISGESLEGAMPLPANAAPQALGGVLTYYRRYLLTSVTGACADEDDDGRRAQDGYREDPGAWASARPAPARAGNGGARGAQNYAPAEDAQPDLRTAGQSSRMFALLGQAGYDTKDRDSVLAYVNEVIGHPIESTKNLTRDEAGLVIRTLEAAAAEKPGHDEQP